MGNKKRPIRSSLGIFYLLRREPLYHKLQYSKVPKFDVAAAVLGVIVGAFVVYLALCSVGSAGADLSDLTVVVWYTLIWVNVIYFYLLSLKEGRGYKGIFLSVFLWLKEFVVASYVVLQQCVRWFR